ncbi:MAG: hypothetical protein ABIS50_08165 [Luteolibacter sp.]|uniref:hypothetical protein n=1 Tax=Luteolibacter sp. TaxID=1962973 RepID=UPI0032673EBE
MKNQLFAFLLALVVLESGSVASANPFADAAAPSQPAPLGGFPPGTTFSFKVVYTYSTKGPAADPVAQVPAPVPLGIPKFKKGDTVKFTIGNKGQLTGPGFSMKYVTDEEFSYAYSANNPLSPANPKTAHVDKNKKNKPTAVGLNFFKSKIVDGVDTLYSVYYALE